MSYPTQSFRLALACQRPRQSCTITNASSGIVALNSYQTMRKAMKLIALNMLRVVAVCTLSAMMAPGASAVTRSTQYGGQAKEQSADKNKQAGPSDAEQKAMAKIEAAPDLAAKIARSEERRVGKE